MRVYLLKPQRVYNKKADGSLSRSLALYSAPAFCEVSDDLGKEWIASGIAVGATADNLVKQGSRVMSAEDYHAARVRAEARAEQKRVEDLVKAAVASAEPVTKKSAKKE